LEELMLLLEEEVEVEVEEEDRVDSSTPVAPTRLNQS